MTNAPQRWDYTKSDTPGAGAYDVASAALFASNSLGGVAAGGASPYVPEARRALGGSAMDPALRRPFSIHHDILIFAMVTSARFSPSSAGLAAAIFLAFWATPTFDMSGACGWNYWA